MRKKNDQIQRIILERRYLNNFMEKSSNCNEIFFLYFCLNFKIRIKIKIN